MDINRKKSNRGWWPDDSLLFSGKNDLRLLLNLKSLRFNREGEKIICCVNNLEVRKRSHNLILKLLRLFFKNVALISYVYAIT